MSEPNPFRELIRRVRVGDEAAATELVRTYEPAIRRAARLRLSDSRLRREFDSTDICQSVFASFFTRAALGQYDLDQPEQLLHLLVDMSHKKLTDRVRAAGAARRDYRRLGPLTPCDDVAARGTNPAREAAGRELLAAFRGRLSDDERRVADQRALGRNWSEIAADRGDSPEALRKRFSRALDRVAAELGIDEPGHD